MIGISFHRSVLFCSGEITNFLKSSWISGYAVPVYFCSGSIPVEVFRIRNNPTEDNFNSLRHDNIYPIIISSDDDDNYSDDEIPDGYQVCYLNT